MVATKAIMKIALLSMCAALAGASCPNNCNKRGTCDKYSRCTCMAGFQGADCSERTCPMGNAWADVPSADDTGHALAECSNMGLCMRESGQCECAAGFGGKACDRMLCNENCNGRGRCVSMYENARTYRDDYSVQYTYANIWDAKMVHGCVCDLGYSGYDCSLKDCPTGDDPLTTGQTNEVQYLKCVAVSGTFVLYYNGNPSSSISYSATAAQVSAALLSIKELTDVTVTFAKSTGKVCQISTNIVKIEFTQQFGNLPPLVALPDSTMSTAGGVVSVASKGNKLSDETTSYTSITGTKENAYCSNRGTCTTADGLCLCYSANGDSYDSSDGYGAAGLRGDCGRISSGTVVSSCPGETACSGRGVCSKTTYKCSCFEGFQGGDCSERVCPKGNSWFEYPTADDVAHMTKTECSDMGMCDRSTGECACRTNYYGRACEYLVCGGGAANPCTGHGKCMSMSELALWSESNGDATTYTYGEDPNDVSTWDGKRIHGCMCDDGWEGYDCSLRTCPRGDDPATYEQHNEVQLLQCKATKGSFKLTFRQFTTADIAFNATATQVKAALDALTSIRSVAVYFSRDGNIPNTTLTTVKPEKVLPAGAPGWGEFKTFLRKKTVTTVTKNVTSSGVYVKYGTAVENITTTEFLAKNDPVIVSNVTAVCRSDGKQVVFIEFESVYGNVPAITPYVKRLMDSVNGDGTGGSGAVIVYQDGSSVGGYTSLAGTTEDEYCSGRGLCKQDSGLCSCFTSWSNSDGKGGIGSIGDCGFRSFHKDIKGSS